MTITQSLAINHHIPTKPSAISASRRLQRAMKDRPSAMAVLRLRAPVGPCALVT